MEALFGSFMNEVSTMKTTKMKKLEKHSGTPEELVERLSTMRYDPKQGHGSAFLVLQVLPEASESEITKAYRRLSLLVHPDKCKLEKAPEAFQVLAQAYADTKDPSYSDKYKDVVGKARARVRQKREKENEARVKKGEDPLDMEGNDFDQEVLGECDRMTTETEEVNEYKNSVLEANMKRQEENGKMAKQQKKEQIKEKRLFDKGRDKRAAGWQTFQANISEKKFKFCQEMGPDRHNVVEQRLPHQVAPELDMTDVGVAKSVGQAGQTGIDREYRKKWR